MKPSRVFDVLVKLVDTNWPAFVWGPPGVGKSAVVRSVANERNRAVIDIRANLLDPTDIRGIPYVSENVARWSPPNFLPKHGSGPGILFFDELSSAPPLVQASLYQLTLDRKVGEYTLPDNWSIVAAGNRIQDGSIAFRMPSALSNRFVHLDFDVDFEDWRDWATTKSINPLIVAFLSVRRHLLFDFSVNVRAFPSPRSWEIVSDIVVKFKDLKDAEDVLYGVIGEGATIELLSFLKDSRISQIFKKLIENPESALIPERLDLKFALISYLVSSLSDDRVLSAARIILKRVEPEVGMVLVRDMLRLRPKSASLPEVLEFIGKHKFDITL